jgi:hypothetical protein
MEEPFQEAVRSAVAESVTLQGVIVSGPYGAEYAFEQNTGDCITWVGDNPRFKTRFGIFREPFFAPLRIEGLRNVTISAVSSYIDYPVFAKILKESLFLILAALVLSLITLLIHSLKNKPAPLVSEKLQETVSQGEARKSALAPVGVRLKSTPPKKVREKTASPVQTPKEPDSERSNIGWESYTTDQLNSELRRSAESRQDLTLIAMELSPAAGDSAGAYQKFTDATVQFFKNRYLIFERGDRGITVILPNTGLEKGFAKAEEFHAQMMDQFPEIFPYANDLRIGLSFRTGRSVRADRMLLEAAKALERTQQEPSCPIVAFKSDPEKYRAFINQQPVTP